MEPHYTTLLGLFTQDIRNDWRNTSSRVGTVIDLCHKIGRADLADEVIKDQDEISHDGRYFRYWDGPYGASQEEINAIPEDLWEEYSDQLSYPPDRTI